MWWNQPRLRDFTPLLPQNILEVAACAYAVVQMRAVTGTGLTRGRRFEQLFYGLCKTRGVQLSERAGSRTMAGQRAASGLNHEVDAATKALRCITEWELKNLTSKLEKNELLIFNGKGLDFLMGSSSLFAKIPLLRFLLSGETLRDESKHFAAQWGIMVIEPDTLPLPLLYEAAAHGASVCLRPAERDMIKADIPWACRPLQRVVEELSDWSKAPEGNARLGPPANVRVRRVMNLQAQLGPRVIDYLDDAFPDWLDQVASQTWREVGAR